MRRSVLVVLLLISSMFVASCQSLAYATPVEITSEARIFGVATSSQRDLVRLSNDTLVTVYVDGNDDLVYAMSDDNGSSWTRKGVIASDMPLIIGSHSIARDGNDLIWCAYGDENEEDDVYYIRVSVYWEGVWSPGLHIHTPEDDEEEQIQPYVAVNSTNEVFVAWASYNHTDDWIEVINFSFEDFPLDMPNPMRVNNSGDPMEECEEWPVLAIDGDDTVHVAYNFINGTTEYVKYSSRAVGETEFVPAINLSMDDVNGEMYPSICVNETGTVFVALTYGDGTDDYMVGLFYGDPPTNKVNITDEVDYLPDLFELSIAWFDGKVHILHDDYATYYVTYINGTPESGWSLTRSISSDIPVYDGFHTHPSLRWGYHHEPKNTLDYVFESYDFDDIFDEDAVGDLYYQDIMGSDISPTDTNPYTALTAMVMSAMSLLLILVVLRGLVRNIDGTFRRTYS